MEEIVVAGETTTETMAMEMAEIMVEIVAEIVVAAAVATNAISKCLKTSTKIFVYVKRKSWKIFATAESKKNKSFTAIH